MIQKMACAVLILTGLYAEAQLYRAKRALADTGERRVGDYLQAGWDIKAAIEGPPRVLVLQKGGSALWCEMREYAMPVTLKGVQQLLTASCAVIR